MPEPIVFNPGTSSSQNFKLFVADVADGMIRVFCLREKDHQQRDAEIVVASHVGSGRWQLTEHELREVRKRFCERPGMRFEEPDIDKKLSVTIFRQQFT